MENSAPQPKRYDVLITNHARERWLERIVDPKRYEHLTTCPCPKVNCSQCTSLIHDIRDILRFDRRVIDARIASCYRDARDHGRKLTDVSFLEAIKKRHGDEVAGASEFLISHSGKAVLVILKKDNDPPVLKTILSADMVEGTIFRNLEGEDLKKVFNRWKHERKMKRL
jgi:hypothetical protein